jgi:AAA domain
LQANCTIDVGSFVRLSPSSDDPHKGQTINQLLFGGSSCVMKEINWDTKQIELSVIPGSSQRYQLYSKSYKDVTQVFQNATLDESPSDFVAGRVDKKLENSKGNHICKWLAPQNPQILPQTLPSESDLEKYKNFLNSLPLKNNKQLDDKQISAVIDGLKTRIQLLQGPPGTGKTETTAIATFMRILTRRSAGDIILITAHTHTAVDNLILRLDSRLPILRQQAENLGITVPGIQLSKVHSSQVESPTGGNVQDFPSKSCVKKVTQMLSNSVLVIGGTTSAILKMVDELNSKTTFIKKYSQGFQTSTLIVDEASMMVFPHFLALATLVKNDGEIMLAGDHRQLAPIITHDWENEDRPPVLLYQPYVSAYQAIQNLKENSDIEVTEEKILRSALDFTFRLPPVIRELIAGLYKLDNIELHGQDKDKDVEEHEIKGTWQKLLQGNRGLYLVLHSERESKRSNQLEVKIIKNILHAGGELSDGSTAILTPHRAQRSLLKTELENYYGNAVDVIDTVEKVQGGERDNVIVSATASNPSAIGKNVEFILSLNRSNVAFSRVKKRLIVVCSKTLLDYIPTELENYEEAILWKALRSECSQLIFTENINGHTVEIFTPPTV